MDKKKVGGIFLESWIIHASLYKYSEGIKVLNDMSNSIPFRTSKL